MHYYLDIQGDSAHACAGEGREPLCLRGLRLQPETELRIKGHSYALDELLSRLLRLNPEDVALWDDRGQLELGRYLYAETIAKLPPAERQRLERAEAVVLHISSAEEFVTRLPWALLTREQVMLSRCGWSIVLSNRRLFTENEVGEPVLRTDFPAVELPPAPRLLVVAPLPESSDAETHLAALERRLRAADKQLAWGKQLRRVATWDEFRRALREFAPQLVYFYGHGKSDAQQGDLLFANAQGGTLRVPVVDVADALNQMPSPPALVYINACLGDAAGFLGVGRQVRAAAVVANRTIAGIQAAQAQGLAFWDAVLLRGQAPHLALHELYRHSADWGLSCSAPHWLTPVLYAHYAEWHAHPPKPARGYVKDADWHLKVDRVSQFATVSQLCREMLRNKHPRCLFFVWYGREGEGIDLFHQRLEVNLPLDLPTSCELYPISPSWPEHLSNPERLFHEVISEAFGVSDLDAIPAQIRAQNQGERQVLSYINHRPVRTGQYKTQEMLDNTINPHTLRWYFEWCDRVFGHLLEPGQFLLIGISFLVNDPVAFRAWFRRERQGLDVRHSMVRLLDAMEVLAEEDLRDFIQLHNIPLPNAQQDQVIAAIMAETGGRYEQTIAALDKWLANGLALDNEKPDEDAGFTPFEV